MNYFSCNIPLFLRGQNEDDQEMGCSEVKCSFVCKTKQLAVAAVAISTVKSRVAAGQGIAGLMCKLHL